MLITRVDCSSNYKLANMRALLTRNLDDYVNNVLLGAYLEDGTDFLSCLQLGVIPEIRGLGGFIIGDWYLYLIEVESVGVYVVKFILFRCLDKLLEGSGRVPSFNLNIKNSSQRLVVNKAYEDNRSGHCDRG